MDDVEMHSSGRTEPVQLAQWSLKNPGRSIYYTLRLLWWEEMEMGTNGFFWTLLVLSLLLFSLCACTMYMYRYLRTECKRRILALPGFQLRYSVRMFLLVKQRLCIVRHVGVRLTRSG